MSYVIAIDGPGAAGKGTVAKRLAAELSILYLDTGKIYRAVGYAIAQAGLIVEEVTEERAESFAKSLTSECLNELIDEGVLANERVAAMASVVSSMPKVRAALLEFQRNVAKSPLGAVLDGRDIGTVVCPDADFKFFVTASVEERAKRRYKELKNKNETAIYDDVLRDLEERDARDANRDTAPMKPAEDAIIVDTTDDSADEVFFKMLKVIGN
jgi:cytidylate kinase